MFLDKYFLVCSDVKLEGLVAVVVDGINEVVGWCVIGWLVIGFDVDADVITLGIDEGIEIFIQVISF